MIAHTIPALLGVLHHFVISMQLGDQSDSKYGSVRPNHALSAKKQDLNRLADHNPSSTIYE